MAKTIIEMAEKSYPIHDDPWMHYAYIDGAKAMLEKIEDCLEKFSNTEDYSALYRKIKELKS